MFYYINKTIFTSIIVLFGYTLSAQDQGIADSLITIYNSDTKIGDDSTALELLRLIAYNHTNPDSSAFYANILINKAKETNNYYWLCRGYFQKGNSYQSTGKPKLALDAYLKSAKYAEIVGDKKSLGTAYSTTGDSYSLAKDHKNAIYYYKKSITTLREIGDSATLASVLFNTGGEYIDNNNSDTALKYFLESQAIFEILNHKIGLAYTNASIGKIYGQKGDFELAKSSLLVAINTLQELGIAQAQVSFTITLARIYLEEGETDKALAITTNCYEVAVESNLMPQVRDASELLSKIYKELGDYENAYNYHFQYIAYRDSINNEQTIREMADLRTEYEVSQKQAELDLVEKESQIHKIIGLGLIVGLALISALAFVLFRNAKREKASNAILQKQRNKLEEINNAKDRFFSIISHDLRGPLGVLKGSASLIHQLSENYEDEEIKDLSAHMEISTDKALNLLNNLLDWALSQSGNYTAEPEHVGLNDIILNTLSLYSHTASTKNIALSYTPAATSATVYADKNSLSTILRNLISNALKFTPQGGTVTINVRCEDGDSCILISDTGIGIAPEKLESLFSLESKKSEWGTSGEKGLGIGLNLVQEFIKLNNGTIKVDSSVGEGTTFTVCLPSQK